MPLRLRHLLLLPLVVVALFAGHSCRRATATPARPSAVSGCDMARVGDGSLRCHLSASSPTHEVVMWFEGEHIIESKVERLTAWGRTSPRIEVRFIDTGTRIVAHVEGGGMLEITGIVDDPGAEHAVRRQWAVPLEQRPDHPELHALVQRWRAFTEPTEAYEILDDLHRFGALAPRWQAAKAWALRGEILQRTATPSEALGAYEHAVALAGADELSLRCRLQHKIAELHLVDRERHLEAERALDDMTGCEALGLVHHVPRAYLLGHLALRRADLEGAIDELRRAIGGAEQVRMPRVGMVAAALLAVAEARAQRFEAADTALRKARELSRGLDLDCEDELALAGHAAAVTAAVPQDRGPGDPAALLLLDALRAECRTSGTVESLGALNIAYALQRWGRNHEAQRWLERLDELRLPPQQRMFQASIAADVAMALGDWPGAGRAADMLATLIDRHPHEASVDLEVQRELVRGRVAMALGDPVAARSHLQRAIDRQDEQLRLVPLGLSTSRVSATLADPARFLVELEREQGEAQAALCTARLLRNRAGRQLADAARLRGQDDERYQRLAADVSTKEIAFEEAERTGSRASLARAKAELEAAQHTLLSALHEASGLAAPEPDRVCKALPAPAPGELALLFHQDPQGRWWLLEWSRDEPLRFHDVGLGNPSPTDDPQRLVERFLHPVRDRLAHASAARLLTSGATHAIVFEALPWDGTTFEQAFDVTWGLDLPPRPGLRRRRAPALQPVVVYTDLYNEFHRVDARVEALFATLERVWGPGVPKLVDASASTRDLQHLSAGAAPLVVLGHNSALAELDVGNPKCGDARSPAPSRPPNPGLVSAPDRPTSGLWINQTSMGLATLLTLAPPRVAILESCGTGPIDALGLDGAVGLGHALVAAGTEQVLATRRVVCPEQAIEFLQAVLEASVGEPLELPRLLRAARFADPDYLHRVLVP